MGLPNVGEIHSFQLSIQAKGTGGKLSFLYYRRPMGQVSVPDERLTKLAEIVHPGRIVPAVCDIVDIAGRVKGASKGEGPGNQFLGNIRECDAIIHVLRCFDNGNIVRGRKRRSGARQGNHRYRTPAQGPRYGRKPHQACREDSQSWRR